MLLCLHTCFTHAGLFSGSIQRTLTAMKTSKRQEFQLLFHLVLVCLTVGVFFFKEGLRVSWFSDQFRHKEAGAGVGGDVVFVHRF